MFACGLHPAEHFSIGISRFPFLADASPAALHAHCNPDRNQRSTTVRLPQQRTTKPDDAFAVAKRCDALA